MAKVKPGAKARNDRDGRAAFGRHTIFSIVLQALALVISFGTHFKSCLAMAVVSGLFGGGLPVRF